MKESIFHSDEFEELIREKTEQYKMYPSENVWKAVHTSLHTRRKWFIGSMAFLVTGILFFAGRELLVPGHPARKLAASTAFSDNPNSDLNKGSQTEDNTRANFVRVRPANGAAGRHVSNISDGSDQDEPGQPYNHLDITISHPVVSQPDLSDLLSHAVQLPDEAPALIAVAPATTSTPNATEAPQQDRGVLESWVIHNSPDMASAHRTADAASAHNNIDASHDAAEAGWNIGRESNTDDASVRGLLETLSARGRQPARVNGNLARIQPARRAATQADIRDSAGNVKASEDVAGEESDQSRVSWLHDYAAYSLPPNPSRDRWLLQLNLVPTVDFRNLSGGTMAGKANAGPMSNSSSAASQNWVDHSPGIGVEFGASVLYRATRNLTLKAGFQFDYSRYKMLAYAAPQSSQEPSYRTPLGNYLFMDSLYSAQPASVNGGPIVPNPVQATLYNDYYALSAPIGFELRVLGNERLQFNIGATIQPSYLLNTNEYIVSADYTTYTKAPSVFRRWNLTGGLEAFLSYQTGPVRWQIGPEFHYQLLSSYNNGEYPISEDMRGYGLKVGITKPLP